MMEAFNERATNYCLSALLATTHQKAADRILSNALKISTASAVYADNLVTGPPEPALRFSPRDNFLPATGKRSSEFEHLSNDFPAVVFA